MNLFAECDVKVAAKVYEYKEAVPSSSHIQIVDTICFCCRITDVPLIKISGCSHNGYLMCYFIKKINLSTSMVCQYCHNILKKIEKFKKQVEQCIINDQQPIGTKIINTLQKSKTVTTSINPEDLKPIIHNSIFIPEADVNESNVDIKDEYLSDESTKSAFEDVLEDCRLGDNVEVEIPVCQVRSEEKKLPNMMKLLESQSKPDFRKSLIVDHSYATAKPGSAKKPTKTIKEIQLELKDKRSTSHPVANKEKLTTRSGNYAVPNINVNPTSSSALMKSSNNRRIARTHILARKRNSQAETLIKNINLFQCGICLKKFDVEAAYDNHLKEHERVRFTRSDLYGKIRMIYLNREEMEREREKRRLKEYAKYNHKCEDCLTSFDHEDSLRNHMKKHDNSKNKHVCEVCKCVYLSQSGLKNHTDSHWRRFQCMECDEKFVQDIHCIRHYNKEHGEDGKRIDDYYSCHYMDCDYIGNDYSSYRNHVRQKHTLKVPCNVCGKNFTSSTSMKNHVMKIHEKTHNRIYKCKECDKQYNDKSALIIHTRSHHRTNPDEMAYCKDCDKQYSMKYYLDVHLRTHSRHVSDDMKRYTCDICCEKFISKQAIRSHIEIKHLGVTFQCSICNKILSCTRALRKHERDKHSGAPPHPPPERKLCQICGKGFTSSAALRCHIWAHKGERPLKCEYCPATFSYNAALYNHKRLVHKVPMKHTARIIKIGPHFCRTKHQS